MSAHEIPAFDAATIQAIAYALADVLVERGLVVHRAEGAAARVLDVGQVADLLGRKPAWVYAHAPELGAFRFGDGPKARLGFDRPSVERWKRDRQMRTPEHRLATAARTVAPERPAPGGEVDPVRDS